jgi:hypothetical protein
MRARLQEPRLGIRMARITYLVHPVFDHGREIRTMGIVARRAHVLAEGHVDVLSFQGLFQLGMTGKTEFTAFRGEELLVFGRMGRMAGKTSARDRCMGNSHFYILVCVAGKTEFIAFLGDQLRVF